ncbi:LOW QUALITY PROTEIN: immediate early response gene 5-like protein [Anolis carolinensis]|uniref:LOW QUALITY PROTEIN: immediate early response gene 5-like protein n=1 Tax=Anolis carolinensis TaxID=28377 RepID=UPI002F2B82BB
MEAAEEGALDAQSLISLSLRKIHSSRAQRGGLKLHKNLLVSYVLRNARQLYFSQRYAEFYRRQQQQQQQQQHPPHLYPDGMGIGGHGGGPHWSLFAFPPGPTSPGPAQAEEAMPFQRCCVLGGPSSCTPGAPVLEASRLQATASDPGQKELLHSQVSPLSSLPSASEEALHFQRCCALNRVGDVLGGHSSCTPCAPVLEASRMQTTASDPGQKELLGGQVSPLSNVASEAEEALHFQRCCALSRVGDVLGGPSSCTPSTPVLEASRLQMTASDPGQKELLGGQVSALSAVASETEEALHFQRCCALGRVGDVLGGPSSCTPSTPVLEASRLQMTASDPGQKELLGGQVSPLCSVASGGFDPRMGAPPGAGLYAGFAAAFGATPGTGNGGNNNGSGLSPLCSTRTTVLDLDTHVVTTVDNGFVHPQDCACGSSSFGACLPLPSPVFPGAKRKYDEEDPRMGSPAPAPAPAPLLPAPHPKRARLDDDAPLSPPNSSPEPPSSHISNLISIFGAGFTGLASRPSSPPCPPTPPLPPPPPPPSPAIDAEQQTLNGQLCSKQALASLGAWTRAIVAF